MNIEPYDFRKPPRIAAEVEQRLTVWLRAASLLAADRIAKRLPFRVDLTLETLEVARPQPCLDQLPDAMVGYAIATDGRRADTLAILPRRLALALVTAMLGEVGTELPPDRELTPVEQSLAEYLIFDVLAALREAWPGAEPLALALDRVERSPKQSRLFRDVAAVLCCRLMIRGPLGEGPMCWIVPQETLLELLQHHAVAEAAEASARPKLEAIARQVPVEIAVGLGSVKIGVSQVAELRAGDVVIFDQRVNEPLTARVAGEKKFRVWPGRVGSRQAFQIDSLIEC